MLVCGHCKWEMIPTLMEEHLKGLPPEHAIEILNKNKWTPVRERWTVAGRDLYSNVCGLHAIWAPYAITGLKNQSKATHNAHWIPNWIEPLVICLPDISVRENCKLKITSLVIEVEEDVPFQGMLKNLQSRGKDVLLRYLDRAMALGIQRFREEEDGGI